MVYLAISFATAESSSTSIAQSQSQLPSRDQVPIVPPRENITVITGQGFGEQPGDAITAFSPDGTLLFYDNTYDEYHDVDPIEGTRYSVLYVAANHVNKSVCGASERCTISFILRTNLSTGTTERIHRSVAPRRVGDNTHDVDRIDEHRLLVADIAYDRVFVLNISTGLIEWEWQAQTDFPISGGGTYPDDWTHVNDIEHLPDGRVMVSLRNQDQVVFIDRTRGLVPEWTLGEENDYSILYEQHNPDYIPPSNGGPAVLVSDSENDRVVEYQRMNGEWVQTWEWSDPQLQWPRDADRLPNGHTLIVDSNGGRVIEIDEAGDIVWEISTKSIYDAERFETGDESTGGRSALALGLKSRSVETAETGQSPPRRLITFVPREVRGAIAFVRPIWMSVLDLMVLAGLLTIVVVWATVEIWWHRDSFEIRSPVIRV